MKCLSLRQPYAELVAQGRKTIETRRWNTNFRGKFLIHVSKAIDKEISAVDKEISAFLNIDCSKLAKGAIGIACLYDVKKYTSKEDFLADKAARLSDNFSNPKYGFLLRDAKKLNEPMPVLGRLGFFNVHGSDS